MPPKRSRPLETYRKKRDFQRTPEPKPKAKSSAGGRLFVVQKHRAQRLHYDFRLELDGVLLSWAVPKGPSLDPSEKRLAVQTEDHPVEYGSFEGIIPEDQYGGGTVMLWDRGSWAPIGDVREQLKEGALKFTLEGRKLRGAWTLIQMKEKGELTKNWLLIKERDDEVRKENAFSVIDEEAFSAVSGRTIAEIATAKDCVWTGDGAQGTRKETQFEWRRGLYARVDLKPGEMKGGKEAKMPRKLSPLEPKVVDSIPSGDGWIHEIVEPGERLLCLIDEASVALRSAEGADRTLDLPQIARALARLPTSSAVLDGVASDAQRYHAFDVLFCDGFDLRGVALLERKQLLHRLLVGAGCALAYCDHVEGHGDVVFAEAKRLGAPGILSKPVSSKYGTGKSDDWRVVHLNAESHSRTSPRSATSEAEVVVAGVKLTHPNRILYPEERVTKRMVAEYYEAVAPMMLPHVANRPLSLYRCPGGIEKESFFQKQLGEMPAEHVRSAAAGDEPFVVIDDVQGLVTLAQWNVLEIHAWGCLEDDLDHPDMMTFDLDPGPDVSWELIVEGAKGLRLLLKELGLESFVKTSGGKGLHVVVPLTPSQPPALKKGSKEKPPPLITGDTGGSKQDWDDVKDFAARAARKIVEVAPKHFTVFMSKPERRGKVFIDYFRNHRGSTCVAPYSTRARPGAFVSTPIAWDQLDGPQPRFHIFQTLDRLSVDPWQGIDEVKQSISVDAIAWLRS